MLVNNVPQSWASELYKSVGGNMIWKEAQELFSPYNIVRKTEHEKFVRRDFKSIGVWNDHSRGSHRPRNIYQLKVYRSNGNQNNYYRVQESKYNGMFNN